MTAPRVRRESKNPVSAGRYRHHEPEYERIFESVDACGGEETLDEAGPPQRVPDLEAATEEGKQLREQALAEDRG